MLSAPEFFWFPPALSSNMSPSKLRRNLARARSHALLLHSRKRSASSRKASNRRRQEWLQWRSQQYQEVPADRIWLLYQICRESKSCFLDQLRSPPALPPGRRQRDVFPCAPVTGSEGMPYTWRRQRWQLFLTFVNAVLDALRWLYCRKQQAPCPSQHTAAQKTAVANLVGRCLDFLERLQKPQHGEWEHLLPDWVPEIPRAAGPQYADLKNVSTTWKQLQRSTRLSVCSLRHKLHCRILLPCFRNRPLAWNILRISMLVTAVNMCSWSSSSCGVASWAWPVGPWQAALC